MPPKSCPAVHPDFRRSLWTTGVMEAMGADKQQLTCVYKASCFVLGVFLLGGGISFLFLFCFFAFLPCAFRMAQYESSLFFFISLCWHLKISRLAPRASPGIVAESTRRRLLSRPPFPSPQPLAPRPPLPPCQRLLLGNTLLMRAAGLGTVLGISYSPVSESWSPLPLPVCPTAGAR